MAPAAATSRIGPNVLRLLVGEAEAAAAIPARERVTLMTFEIDDMNPQIYGVLIDELLAAGALDVYYTAVQMKKNRPGTLVTVMAPPERRTALSAIVFRETTTLGVRYHDVEREVLARETRDGHDALGRRADQGGAARRRRHQRGAGVRRVRAPWPVPTACRSRTSRRRR